MATPMIDDKDLRAKMDATRAKYMLVRVPESDTPYRIFHTVTYAQVSQHARRKDAVAHKRELTAAFRAECRAFDEQA